MATRYGDRARTTSAVPTFGRPPQPTQQTKYEQRFTSPGTWTWPGQVTHVQVLLVGGGGGSGSITNNVGAGSGPGGGGGVYLVPETPVTGPVPVTVGAGGTAGAVVPLPSPVAPPATAGGVGGTSSFGPLSVGGGGGGFGVVGAALNSTTSSAPPIGGGGGAGSPVGVGGAYGTPASTYNGGGAGSTPYQVTNSRGFCGFHRYGYGAGGQGTSLANPYAQSTVIGVPSLPNTGNGASGALTFPGGTNSASGNAGDGGCVIVTWWQ